MDWEGRGITRMARTYMIFKEFLDELAKPEDGAIKRMKTLAQLAPKVLELEAIERWFNVMYGVEFEINIKPTKRWDGRNYKAETIEKTI